MKRVVLSDPDVERNGWIPLSTAVDAARHFGSHSRCAPGIKTRRMTGQDSFGCVHRESYGKDGLCERRVEPVPQMVNVDLNSVHEFLS